ncbi:MAG: tetratricopeptide repeat protein [Candidatus Eiseniibacteriota bacterium]
MRSTLPFVVPAAAFLALHLIARGGGVLARWWGVDALAYLPGAASASFALAAAALFVPAARNTVIRAAATVGVRPVIGAAALGALAAAVSLAMPATTHLLGDGLLHLGDLQRLASSGASFSEVSWANENAPLANWTVWALHRAGGWSSPLTTFRVLGFACGVGYILAAAGAAWRLAPDGAGRALLLGTLLTAGYVQLFAGYVELYAPLPPLVLLYVAAGAVRAGSVPWIPAILLGVLVPLHFTTATLWPSLAVLCLAAARAGVGRAAAAAACVALPAVVSAALLTAVGFDAGAWLAAPRGANVLPLAGDPGFRQAYRLLDPPHFVDVANQLLLVAPAALLALPLAVRRGERDAAGPFLGTAALVPLLFTFVANPEVGAFRDWDALSFAAVPLTVLAARSAARAVPDRLLAHGVVVICGAAALHTVAWLAVNAGDRPAEARFAGLLEACPLSRHALAYGSESLGSLRLAAGRAEEACASFESAARAAPDNPRHHISAGKLHLALGRPDRARERFAAALRLDPSRAEAWFGMGTLELARRDAGAALAAFRAATEADPAFAPAWFNLGAVLRERGELDASREALRRYLLLDPAGRLAEQAREWVAE